MSRRVVFSVLAALVCLVAAAPGASAGTVVFTKGTDIWAMQDDGSNPRLLIPVGAAAGMSSIQQPAVAPAGTTVTFEGSTKVNEVHRLGLCGTFPTQYSCFTWHYGFNATGVYRWTGGATVERLTGAPAYCWNCTDGDQAPEPRADAAIDYAFQHCQGWLDDGTYSCTGAIKSTSGQAYPACSDLPDDPSPNPANASQLAYTGCTSGGNSAIIVTGPNHAGEHVVGCDDAPQEDASWSPSGGEVVDAEGGLEPGIWVYAASNTSCAGTSRHAVVAPSGVTFASPRHTGSRILFEAQGEIWSVPASCTTCAFPSGATQLTSGGDNHAPAWTSAALPARIPASSGTTPGTGTGSGVSGTSGAGTTPAPARDTTAPVTAVTFSSTQRILRQRNRIILKVRANEAATLTVSGRIVVPGTDPKLTTVTTALPAGTTVVVRITLSKKALRAIRRAWARRAKATAVLTLRTRDAAGNTATSTKRIALRR